MKKRLLAAFLSLVMVVGLLPTVALAADTDYNSADAIASAKEEFGQSENSNFWYIGADSSVDAVYAYLTENEGSEPATYTLHIKGTGVMADYATANDVPWNSYKDQITIGIVEDDITHLGARAFVLTSKLESVTLPNSLISIGESAFNQSGLTSITLPEKLETIGKNAFWHGKLSGKLVIPETVKTISDGAFDDNELTEVTLPDGLTTLGSGALKANPLTTMPEIPLGITSLVTTFQNCTSLTEIEIPSHVTTLDRTFMGCTGLTSVVIPETVESYVGAFNGCTSLTNAVIESRATDIGGQNTNNAWGVFGGCSSLKTVTVPNHVTVIGVAAFDGCTSLETTDFIEKATTIGREAFQGCKSLKGSLNLNATEIGIGAFDECSGLGPNISFANATSVGENAFRDCFSLNGIVYAKQMSGGANRVPTHSVAAITNDGIFPESTVFEAGKLAEPIRNGYKFDGWYTQDGTDGNEGSWGQKIEADAAISVKTCYAKWTNSTYSIAEDSKAITLTEQTYGYSDAPSAEVKVTATGANAKILKAESSNSAFVVSPTTESTNMTVTITAADGLDAGTYTGTVYIYTGDGATHWVNVSLTVDKATLTAAYAGETIYVGDTPALEVTVTGFVNGETAETAEGYAAPTLTNSNTAAGSYALTPTGGSAKNYDFTYVGGTLTIQNRSSSTGTTRYTVTIEDSDNGSVTSSHSRASRGTTVTLTVNPDEGYELDELTVTDASGNNVTVNRSSDTRYTFTMPRGNVTVEAAFVEIKEEPDISALPFTDVGTGDWFYDAVAYAYDNGMMSGIGNNRFAPESNLTRAMLVQVLWNLEGNPEASAITEYSDVASDAWYYDAVQWATDKNIVGGYGNGIYGPEDDITREQMALMLYRYAQYKGYDTTQSGADVEDFADYEDISDWALEGVTWAVNAGLLNGKGNGILDPTGDATRAEVAQILMNFCENIVE